MFPRIISLIIISLKQILFTNLIRVYETTLACRIYERRISFNCSAIKVLTPPTLSSMAVQKKKTNKKVFFLNCTAFAPPPFNGTATFYGTAIKKESFLRLPFGCQFTCISTVLISTAELECFTRSSTGFKSSNSTA